MKVFSINCLSLITQSPSVAVFKERLDELLGCVQVISFALLNKSVRLLFDPNIEHIPCADDLLFVQCLKKTGDRDAINLWYLYTRNKNVERLEGPLVKVLIEDNGLADDILGDIHAVALHSVECWLSFSGEPRFEQESLVIREVVSKRDYSFKNFSRINRLQSWWPKYEHNPKHRKKLYFREGGNTVSPMTMTQQEAQRALDISVEQGGVRLSRLNNITVVFRQTKDNVWHGYEVEGFVDIENIEFEQSS